MENHISYKYRLYPNKKQKEFIDHNIQTCIQLYNLMLDDSIAYYKQHKERFYPKVSDYRRIIDLSNTDGTSLSFERETLKNAYKKFFDKFNKFPHHKKERMNGVGKYTSYCINNNIRLSVDDKKVKLPKIGWVKFKKHRDFPDKSIIKKVTIEKTGSLEYYISFLLEYEYKKIREKNIENISDERILGLDFSIPHFYVDSNGNSPNLPNFYLTNKNKIDREYSSLMRKQKGSKNFLKQIVRINKNTEKVTRQQQDWINKLVNKLCANYDCICVEDLDLDEMRKNKKMRFKNKIRNSQYSYFIERLKLKMYKEGKLFVKVGKYFPSSKKCHSCGYINNSLKLSDRKWECPECGFDIDRDYNAALNIREEGIRILRENK